MQKTLKRWDVTQHLNTEAEMLGYLEACFKEDPGDGSLVRAALGDIAKARGMSQLANKAGLSRQALYRALSETGNPHLSTVMKVSHALGLQLTVQPLNSDGH